jgi:hypothetical protein
MVLSSTIVRSLIDCLSLSYKTQLLRLAAIPTSEYRTGLSGEQLGTNICKDGLDAADGFKQHNRFCSARWLFLYFLFESMISDFALCVN